MSGINDPEQRVANMVSRGVIVKATDQPKVQVVEIRLHHGQHLDEIERFQGAGGYSHVPMPMDPDGKGTEIVVVCEEGDASRPIVIAVDDRRYRPKNMKPGENARFDDQGQISKIARDGYENTSKKLSLTAGSEPDTTFELNQQLRGLAARMAQAEHSLHGLFDVTSRFRQLVQGRVPEVAAIANILNQDPSGLPLMAAAIEAKAQAYLQEHVIQALAKFLTPNLAGLASVLAGGIEGQIQALQGQLGKLISANPAVATIDALRADIANLATSGASDQVIKAGTAAITSELNALINANPVMATVDTLRSQLAGLVSQAGDGLNFLQPQMRMVQGLTKSLRLSQDG